LLSGFRLPTARETTRRSPRLPGNAAEGATDSVEPDRARASIAACAASADSAAPKSRRPKIGIRSIPLRPGGPDHRRRRPRGVLELRSWPILPLFGRSFGVRFAAVGTLISSLGVNRLVAGPLVDRWGEGSRPQGWAIWEHRRRRLPSCWAYPRHADAGSAVPGPGPGTESINPGIHDEKG
jgi:hypothetical protein